MPTTILTYDTSKLPNAMDAIPHHPSADKYIEGLRDCQRAIVAQAQKMKRVNVLAIKQHHRGIATSAIALELKVSAGSINRAINTDAGQKLIALLAYYQEAIDGPNEAQRQAMLWRIASNSETVDPRTSIASIGELNKMSGIGKDAKENSEASTTVNITINQQLTRTALDG